MACAGSSLLNLRLFLCVRICCDLRRVLVHRVGVCAPSDAHAQSCSPNPQRCSSFDSDLCVLGRCCFFWLSRRCDRERYVCHGNGPYGTKVSAEIWPSVHRDTPLSSPSACQTIFMHPMNFYPVPTMIAHFILLYSGIMLRAEPCRTIWIYTPVRFGQYLMRK